jgi:hypothetical protein
MQSRNVHRQRFPSVESIASWNNHGDSIELEADSLLQVKINGHLHELKSAPKTALAGPFIK